MKKREKTAFAALALLFVLLFIVLAVVACGDRNAQGTGVESSRKLPPGMTEEEAAASEAIAPAAGEGTASDAASGNTSTSGTSAAAAGEAASAGSSAKSVNLSGVEFTVVAARRQNSNKLVSSSGQREVSGDFLEVELAIKNAGDALVDLSRFSFRLWNPYITASSYDDYYGNVTTYGGYVAKNTISASLLDYASLQQVAYTLRMGEEVDDVFLFYDLNPLSVSPNQGFTKEGANLIVYDMESGEKAEVNLAGFAD